MKALWLIAFAILITGCETTPPVDFDTTFADYEITEKEVTYAEELPKIKKLQCYPGEGDSCRIVGYTSTDDIDRLETYKIRSEANVTIANENATALEYILGENKELVAAGRSQEIITKFIQERLQFEKAERLREKWYYRLMLVFVGAAGIYASGN